MAEEETVEGTEDESPAKKSKLPLIIGIVLALAGAGGGFFAASSGLILGEEMPEEEVVEEPILVEPLNGIAFIELDPLVININRAGRAAHLRFVAHLEVNQQAEADVTLLLPRILDVLNNYLRAVDFEELEEPGSLIRLRSQMLRRIQIVAGEERVRDLLISEFVVN